MKTENEIQKEKLKMEIKDAKYKMKLFKKMISNLDKLGIQLK